MSIILYESLLQQHLDPVLHFLVLKREPHVQSTKRVVATILDYKSALVDPFCH